MLFKDFFKTEFISKSYLQSKLLSIQKMEEKYGEDGSINHLQRVHHETFKPVRGYR